MKLAFTLSAAMGISAIAGDPPLYFSDFEDPSRVAQEWSVEGTGTDLAIVSGEKAASGHRSLALVDHDPEKYAAWLSKEIDLPPEVLAKGSLALGWKELYLLESGQAMRFSVLFLGGDEKQAPKHFVRRGLSEGWDDGRFSEVHQEIPIPPGATQIKLKMSSAIQRGGEGEFYIDDLQIGGSEDAKK